MSDAGKIELTTRSLHLDKKSEHVIRHHTNWRLQSVRALEHDTPNDFHYSSVVTMSKKDLPRVREILIGAIEEIRGVIRESGDEVVYSYLLDLFPVLEGVVE